MVNSINKTPWNEEYVNNLNELQKQPLFHGYTCDRNADECEVNIKPRDYSKDGLLIATVDGWECPCGNYKQKWAHPVTNDDIIKMKKTYDDFIRVFTKNQDIPEEEKRS